MKKHLFLILLLAKVCLVYTQQLELVSSGGDFFIYSNYNISWSLGEPVAGTVHLDGSTISQGYQQVNDSGSGIPENQGSLAIRFFISPNPAQNEINLRIENCPQLTKQPLKCIGYSIIGEIVFEIELKSQETSINISKLTPGVYLIRIFNNKQSLQLSKTIQKI